MAEQEQDRSEQATPFKLKEARRRGQVAKSMEINSLIILSVGLGMAYMVGESMFTGMLNLGQGIFNESHNILLSPTAALWLYEITLRQLIDVFWPLFAALVIAGILGNVLQTGPVFSFFPLKPDIQRLNPVAGFKRVFSSRLLFESFKTIVKLGIFSSVLYFSLMAVASELLGLLDSNSGVYGKVFIDSSREVATKLLGVLLLIALLDLLYSRWHFSKQMRMSMRDIKDEVKRREGDPQIKSKLRQLQREAAKRTGSLQRVKEADVLITNPTHLSIAIRYERETMNAPLVIAKGSGELALKMRLASKKYGVPVIENKALARNLYRQVELDNFVPEELFPVVAKILVWVYAMADNKSSSEVVRR